MDRKAVWLQVAGAIVLVAVLAGAAFLAMRYLQQGPVTWKGIFGSSSGRGQRIRIEVKRSKDLPQRDPDLEGMLVSADGNSLYVQAVAENSAQVEPGSPTMEIVVTRETRVYRDATLDNLNRLPPASQSFQQVLEPFSAGKIEPQAVLLAWGEKRGDRLIADTLLCLPDIDKPKK